MRFYLFYNYLYFEMKHSTFILFMYNASFGNINSYNINKISLGNVTYTFFYFFINIQLTFSE